MLKPFEISRGTILRQSFRFWGVSAALISLHDVRRNQSIYRVNLSKTKHVSLTEKSNFLKSDSHHKIMWWWVGILLHV